MSNEASRSIDLSALNEDSPFHRLLGLTVSRATPGEVEVVMPYSDRLLANTTSPYIHGGAIATLIDVAGNFAVIAAIDRDIPTIDLRVDYLRPVRKGALRAVGRTVKVGRRLGIADVEVFDEDGQIVAIGRGLFSTV
ncbi:MAG: PaaI family thioesterase [Bacillati bacterium ANGP1]|uniref:PaaI family thioesterase n=1 Tax=Candidatus Segetimicrobium genomatis TaxID=2569760 RepID=A0A537IVD7_9BACT|nr:MAG: PaaI family thioesterase [Terrabacteria group bacterium ANGP1]